MQGIRWAGGAVGFESHGLADINIAQEREKVKSFYWGMLVFDLETIRRLQDAINNAEEN
jgi:hypothetical protein